MMRAPVAAMVISISMVKGIPTRAIARARFATGARPISVASTKAQCARPPGTASRTAQAAARSAPVRISRRPLAVVYHAASPASAP